MDTGVFERYEMKYLITIAQKAALTEAIKERMDKDAFGDHTVTSLYFDMQDRRVIRRSMEKPVYKEKLRLRCYGTDCERVYLELKKKYRGIVYKRREGMSLESAKTLIEGKRQARSQIERECAEFCSRHPGLRPAMLISYEREAYFARGDEHDVRITFDSAIRYRETEDYAFTVADTPLLTPGRYLMEVKLPGVMPKALADALDELAIYPSSFSKYGCAFENKMKNSVLNGEKELIYCA